MLGECEGKSGRGDGRESNSMCVIYSLVQNGTIRLVYWYNVMGEFVEKGDII